MKILDGEMLWTTLLFRKEIETDLNRQILSPSLQFERRNHMQYKLLTLNETHFRLSH